MGFTPHDRLAAQHPQIESRHETAPPLDPFFDISDDLLGLADMATGRWTKTNAAFLQHLGYTEDEMRGIRVSSLVHSDDLALCNEAAAELCKGRRVTFKNRILAKTGHYLWVSWTLEPRAEFATVYSVGRLHARTEPSRQPACPTSRQPSSATHSLEAARAFTFSWVRANDDLDLDSAAETVLGIPLSALPTGHRYLELVDPRDQEDLRSRIAATSITAPQVQAAYRVKTPSRGLIWIEETGRVVFTADGRKSGIVGLCQDITARKQAEASAELVMNEMTHRAKNMLTVVQAVLQFTKADTVEAYAAAIRHRLHALARIQGLLATDRLAGVDFSSVIAAEFEPFGGLDGTRLTASGPSVRIASHTVQTLTLVLHELATNAAKYGALSVPQGRISIVWTLDPEGIELIWRETDGPTVSPPTRKGFGHTLVAASVSQIGAASHLDFRPEGLVCKLRIPRSGLTQPKPP